MTGILCTGGEGPPPETIKRICGGLNGVLVAAADSGLVLAEAAGMAVDWITGDMDSLDNVRRLDRYPAGRVMRYTVDKDYTDTELALSLLWEQGCEEVWIIGAGGGRIDHLFAVRSLFERERFPRRWITAGEDIRCIDAAAAPRCSLSLTAGALVSVFPLGDGPWQAASGGLAWALDAVRWNRGLFGISNRAPEGACTIEAVRGRFMVIVPGGMGE
jgi:thiamine pyrophosphokinase